MINLALCEISDEPIAVLLRWGTEVVPQWPAATPDAARLQALASACELWADAIKSGKALGGDGHRR
jgi:hypothetical protein